MENLCIDVPTARKSVPAAAFSAPLMPLGNTTNTPPAFKRKGARRGVGAAATPPAPAIRNMNPGPPLMERQHPSRSALREARAQLNSRERNETRAQRAAKFEEQQKVVEAKRQRRIMERASASSAQPGNWFNLDPVEEQVREKLYQHKRAAVEATLSSQEGICDGLLTQQGFGAAMAQLNLASEDTVRRLWQIYGAAGLLSAGRLPVQAFMQRFIVKPPCSAPTPLEQPQSEMELSQAVLLNQQRIIALCRRADKAHRGVVPAAAFFRIMAKLGMALNQVERQMVAAKFVGRGNMGIRYADFIRAFMSRSSLI